MLQHDVSDLEMSELCFLLCNTFGAVSSQLWLTEGDNERLGN
jgi:hypothetical protein